ncbi:TetR/AcrR family transcriptional regulator, partial [Streptomyces sp900105245]
AAWVLHRDLRARSLEERELAGAADAPLVASAVAATFAGVLADWLHGLLRAAPEEVADQVWQLLVALHRSR